MLSLDDFIYNLHGANSHFCQVTHYLGGKNYVFWGGREGYQSLLNTDMGRELDHLVSYYKSLLVKGYIVI